MWYVCTHAQDSMWCVCMHARDNFEESVIFSHWGPVARTQAIRPDNSVFIHLAAPVERSPSMELCEGDFECLWGKHQENKIKVL